MYNIRESFKEISDVLSKVKGHVKLHVRNLGLNILNICARDSYVSVVRTAFVTSPFLNVISLTRGMHLSVTQEKVLYRLVRSPRYIRSCCWNGGTGVSEYGDG